MPTIAKIKVRQELPDLAKPTADLVERLGFHWSFDYEYPTPDREHRLQIRDEKHYAPKVAVTQYAAAMARGDKFAPIVVTEDGYLVDGNTRVEAARKNKYPTVHALVIDVRYENCTDAIKQRLWTLGAGFNVRNGRGIDRNEIRSAVEQIGNDPTYTATRIAALIGTTDATVQHILSEKRARERAEKAGLNPNGSVSASQLARLGQASDKLNDEPFKELFSLVQDAGLAVGEVGEVIRQMRDAKSDQGALDVVAEHRRARQEQISEYRASGKSKPPNSAKLRQRLGFILGYQGSPDDLVERNSNLVPEYRDMIGRAIETLDSVLVAQSAAGEQLELAGQSGE